RHTGMTGDESWNIVLALCSKNDRFQLYRQAKNEYTKDFRGLREDAMTADRGNQSPNGRSVRGGRYGHQQLALHSSRAIPSHSLGIRLLGAGKLRNDSSGPGHVWQRTQEPF